MSLWFLKVRLAMLQYIEPALGGLGISADLI